MMPLVSIIILNYNGEKFIKRCLSSVLDTTYPRLEIIVIDNGSTDNSYEIIKQYESKVKLIRIPYNIGYSAGNNLGIKVSKGDYIVLLNNDTIVNPSWISELVKVAESDQSIGILGCKVYYLGTKIIQHAGGKLNIYSDTLPHTGAFEKDHGQYNEIKDVDYVSGVAMMINRKIIEKIGLLDVDYFLYWEDVDYCYRAKKAGYRVVYVPTAIIYHYEGGSAGKREAFKRLLLERNRVLFVLKNFSSKECAFFILNDTMKQLNRVREGLARLLCKTSYWLDKSRIKRDSLNQGIIKQRIAFTARSIILSFIGLFYSYLYLIIKGPFIRKYHKKKTKTILKLRLE
ncbi:MAG: glycosyltransferase family 2 protein [Candidatus Anstonellales archaeon]